MSLCCRRDESSPRGPRRRWRAIRGSSRLILAMARRSEWRRRERVMADPLLAIDGLRAGYGATEILRGVDLSVAPEEIVAVLGANGAGKSTLNRTISGVMRAWDGAIRFNGAAIEHDRP